MKNEFVNLDNSYTESKNKKWFVKYINVRPHTTDQSTKQTIYILQEGTLAIRMAKKIYDKEL